MKTALIWVVLIAAFLGFFVLFNSGPSAHPSIPVDDVFTRARTGEIEAAEFEGNTMVVHLRGGDVRQADISRYQRATLRDYLEQYQVSVREGAPASSGSNGSLWFIAVALGVVAGFVVLLRRLRQGGMSSIWSLRRTNAKLLKTPPQVTFADVGGNEEAKVRLRDVVGFLREPTKWQKTGARPPRGVLLEGGPGLGKTLLARALAGEAKVPIFTASGSDFVELFVGVGAARVRDLFETASKHAPCIVFIDELDAVARKRGAASSALVHQEREQALNQLLVAMDGFAPLDKVIVVAATNRADVLDPAILRPGRFDVRLHLSGLDEGARRAVLAIHVRKKPMGPSVDLNDVARRTAGCSGAELEHLTNEAALSAVRAGREHIEVADFDAALLARTSENLEFDALDATLLAATTQLAKPVGPLRLRLELTAGTALEGELLWADPQSLKLKTATGVVVLSRNAIARFHAAEGTAAATLDSLQQPRTEVGTA